MTETITINRNQIVITTDSKTKITRSTDILFQILQEESRLPIGEEALPDGIKILDWRLPYLIVVHQQPPHVRQLRWITKDSLYPYGKQATYHKVRLSIPYTLTFLCYVLKNSKLYLNSSHELYFCNQPLKSKSQVVSFPSLLNISVLPGNAYNDQSFDHTWICTQYLNYDAVNDNWIVQLHKLLDHVWNGGFNLSSEHHEGASWYTRSTQTSTSIPNVDHWQEKTVQNEYYGLTIPWLPAQPVQTIIDSLFYRNGYRPVTKDFRYLYNRLVNSTPTTTGTE